MLAGLPLKGHDCVAELSDRPFEIDAAIFERIIAFPKVLNEQIFQICELEQPDASVNERFFERDGTRGGLTEFFLQLLLRLDVTLLQFVCELTKRLQLVNFELELLVLLFVFSGPFCVSAVVQTRTVKEMPYVLQLHVAVSQFFQHILSL